MRKYQIVLSMLFLTAGMGYPLFYNMGVGMFKLETSTGMFNFLYVIYAVFLIMNLFVAWMITRKNQKTEKLFGWINVGVMTLYLIYMISESGKPTYIVAIVLGYLITFAIQLILLTAKAFVGVLKEEKNIKEKANEGEKEIKEESLQKKETDDENKPIKENEKERK